MSIAFTDNGTDLPIVRLKLTEGKVCANPDVQMKTEGRTVYKLLNSEYYGDCTTKVGNQTTDPRYTLIGSIKENRVFEDNGVNSVARNLPRYPLEDSVKYDWNLYASTYFDWKLECEKQTGVDRQQMVSLLNSSEDLSGYQKTVMIVIIVHVRIFQLL